VHAPGGRLYAIGGRRSQPCFAVAFPSDGARVVQLSGSGTERGYPERPPIPRLRIEPDGVIQLARGSRDSEPSAVRYGDTAGRDVRTYDNLLLEGVGPANA
jgi:hypothetical protein